MLSQYLQTQREMAGLRQSLCKAWQENDYNKLQALAGGNKYAVMDVYGPGHRVSTRGAAVYITQCSPVQVELRNPRMNYLKPGRCTKEMPIGIGGMKTFADPLTRVITKGYTEVDCSAEQPVVWKIGDEWLCASPEVKP